MKRRFVECAILLGIVMSVMFLAQTQDGIGHDKASGHTDSPHTHDPSFRVNSDGTLASSGGCDPRGNLYSGVCGAFYNEYVASWGFRYYGGKYTTNTNNPADAKQNLYQIRVDATASASYYYCQAAVKPSITYLKFFPENDGFWQGTGTIHLSYGCITYHVPQYEQNIWGDKIYIHCHEETRDGTTIKPNPTVHDISLIVDTANITGKTSTALDMGVTGNVINASGNITNGTEVTFSDVLFARGFGIELSLGYPFYEEINIRASRVFADIKLHGNPIPEKQNKTAWAFGHLSDGEVTSNVAMSIYRGLNLHDCPGGS